MRLNSKAQLGRESHIAGRIQQATLENIRTLLQSEKPVVLDFCANWCAPPHAMPPILRHLAERFENRIIFAKVDVQNSRDLAEQFSVKNLPTIILFRNGKEWDRLSGVRSRSELNKIFEKLSS